MENQWLLKSFNLTKWIRYHLLGASPLPSATAQV
jgi:hypothetical protein